MSELPDVSGGETITAARDNQVKERSAMRYASAAARDTSIPAPVAGSLAYLQDTDTLTMYDASTWVTVPIGDFLPIDGTSPMTGPLTAQPGGIVQAAATSGVIQRWNGDGDTNSQRRYEWRRSAAGGVLELYAITAGSVSVLIATVFSDGLGGFTTDAPLEIKAGGEVTTYQAGVNDSQLRNVTISASAPTGGIDGDIWMQT